MKAFRQFILEYGNMTIDLEKARKEKIFKGDEKKAEKIIFALIRDGYMNLSWDVSSHGWEMQIQEPSRGQLKHFPGQTPLETLEAAKKKLRLKL